MFMEINLNLRTQLLKKKSEIEKEIKEYIKYNIKFLLPVLYTGIVTKEELNYMLQNIIYSYSSEINFFVESQLKKFIKKEPIDEENIIFSSIILYFLEIILRKIENTQIIFGENNDKIKISYNLLKNKVFFEALDPIKNTKMMQYNKKPFIFEACRIYNEQEKKCENINFEKNIDALNFLFSFDFEATISLDDLILSQNYLFLKIYFSEIILNLENKKSDFSVTESFSNFFLETPVKNENILCLKKKIIEYFGKIRDQKKGMLNYIQEEFFASFMIYEEIFSTKELDIIMSGKFFVD